jgi:chromosome segregation ATPase
MSVLPLTASQESDAMAPEQTDARQPMAGVQQELEQLLRLGRAHLQDLRARLQLTATEGDRLQAEIADSASAHQRAVDALQGQMDDLRTQFQDAAAERNRMAAQLGEQDAAHQQFAQERADERSTFKRLMDEALCSHREMTEQLEEQRRQIEILHAAAVRAQSLAREIVGVHDSTEVIPDRTKA